MSHPGPLQRQATHISVEPLNHTQFINNRKQDNKGSRREMTKSKFNRMIQEVGGRLPCWREDTYEINRKSQEREDANSSDSEGSITSEKPQLETEGPIYDQNWARKKKTGHVNGKYQTKVLDTNEDKMFPRKKKSDLIMY
eukprot:TRINITY_DN4461_c0_g1_i2.p1 TRINITY_DN4461_c0_g1~~TRINITY_DN4461_c0_g1_i2.p1  ORF type:complete len:140 (-),score=29.69 TRINITY_DN4461_c0_g1_i2:49-468(-)